MATPLKQPRKRRNDVPIEKKIEALVELKRASLQGREFLQQLNRKMKCQKRKILLFLDNAQSHPDIQMSNVRLVFFPVNIAVSAACGH